MKPAAVGSVPTGKPTLWIDIVQHWDLVICDLGARYGIDLYDPAVLSRPWPGIRTMIYSLINGEGLLAKALRR